MKNPLIVFAGVIITAIAVPICISIFAYDSSSQMILILDLKKIKKL